MDSPLAAVLADITRPPVSGTPGSSPGATVHRGGHRFQANAASVDVIRQIVKEPRALLALAFEDLEGRHWFYAFGAYRDLDGKWRSSGAAGSSGRDPVWPPPWSNFGGWGWPAFLCLGGRVSGPEVAIVRVTDANGLQIDDMPEHRVALILCNEAVALPLKVELIGGAGEVLKSQTYPPVHPR